MSMAWSVRSRTVRLGLVASMLGLVSLARRCPGRRGGGHHADDAVSGRRGRARARPSASTSTITTARGDPGGPVGHRRPERLDGEPCGAVDSPSTASQTDGTIHAHQGDPRCDRPGDRDCRDQRIVVHGVTTAKNTDSLSGRRPRLAQRRRERDPDDGHAAAQGRVRHQLHLHADPHEQHRRRPAVQCDRDRPRRLDGHGAGRFQRAGGERGGQGRQQHSRDRDRQARRRHDRRRLPDRGRCHERQPDGPRGPPGRDHRELQAHDVHRRTTC